MLELLQIAQQSWQERWIERIFQSFLGAGVPAIGWLVNNRRRARKQMFEEQEKVRAELDKKHRENTKRLDNQDEKLDEILNERRYIQPHMHREISGPLTVEGLHFPKK